MFLKQTSTDDYDDKFDSSKPFSLSKPVGMSSENKREDVAKVESLLGKTRDLNLAQTDGPTGYFGERLNQAVKGFQKNNKLKTDGVLNPGGPTIRKLASRLAPKPKPDAGGRPSRLKPIPLTRSVGMSEENKRRDVAKVESLLGKTKHLNLAKTDGPTGYFGERLKQAVQRFQKDNKLKTDGVLNPGGETIRKLTSVLAPKVNPPANSQPSQSRPRTKKPGVNLLALTQEMADKTASQNKSGKPAPLVTGLDKRKSINLFNESLNPPQLKKRAGEKQVTENSPKRPPLQTSAEEKTAKKEGSAELERDRDALDTEIRSLWGKGKGENLDKLLARLKEAYPDPEERKRMEWVALQAAKGYMHTSLEYAPTDVLKKKWKKGKLRRGINYLGDFFTKDVDRPWDKSILNKSGRKTGGNPRIPRKSGGKRQTTKLGKRRDATKTQKRSYKDLFVSFLKGGESVLSPLVSEGDDYYQRIMDELLRRDEFEW